METDYLQAVSAPSMAIMQNVARIGAQLKELKTKMLAAEANYSAAKKEYEHYANVIVPQEMYAAGIENLSLAEGGSITLNRQYFCNPNKNPADRKIISDWLKAHGGEHLIKSTLSVAGEDADALKESGVPYTEDTAINTNSLKAFLKAGIGLSGTQQFKIDEIPSCIHFQETVTAEIK